MKLLNVLSIALLNERLKEYLEINFEKIEINLNESFNYTLAEDVYAKEDIPQFNKSTVDGYALIASDTMSASDTIPSVLKYQGSVGIGISNTKVLNKGECYYINTGAMLPQNADAVVMIENTDYINQTKEVLINQKLATFENVTIPGSDIKKGQLLFNKNECINERVLGVLASQGITKVKVYKKIEVIVLSSGNELVNYTKEVEMAQIRDINTIMLTALLEKQGFHVKKTFLIKDDYDTYLEILENNEADIYITSGGSSQGNEDYTYDVFNKITDNVICHGLSTKPGKPTIAAIKDKKLYLGLPGNPVSAFLVLYQTLISTYQSFINKRKRTIKAKVAHNIVGSPGKDSVILVNLTEKNNYIIAQPIYYRSSNVHALAGADGYFVIEANLEGINKDDEVEVILF